MSPLRVLFTLAALYDGLLGLLFLFFGRPIYAHMNILPPNHWGYVKFSAAILVIFGWMFGEIARRPAESRNLIKYGVLLKICYVGIVAWYQFHGGVPAMWLWFALCDAIFLLLFLFSYRAYDGAPAAQGAG